MKTRATRNPLIVLGIAVGVIAILAGAAVAATAYTSRPGFCTSCHEMTPYYSAWNAGPHTGVACVDCHVDPGLAAQVPHKVEALREVYVHFTSNPTFPGTDVSPIPDSRCLACHSGTIAVDKPGFDHEQHRQGRSCVQCHTGVGHEVSPASLAQAGILDPAGARARKDLRVASVGAGAANIPAHPAVTCTDCHDLAATGCQACHLRDAAGHPVRPTVSATLTADPASCVRCHSAATWAFSHPADPATCTSCHPAPAKHRTGACTQCHTTGDRWTFTHPDSAATCTACHARPAGHATKTCSTCHATGVSWAFRHPASRDCSACHKKPSGHYAGACAACHKPTQPFASARFTHPGSGARCTDCHKRPAAHSSGACASCHKTGVSWKFAHPSSRSCASCHRAPSNHYGTSCASCHTPSRAWSSATFSHPSVPGGKHTYRSFSCSSCHPNGYGSVNCTSCHERNDD